MPTGDSPGYFDFAEPPPLKLSVLHIMCINWGYQNEW
ncbi:hypothetical protein OKW42_006541 [Paraburkholderia sp. WC7.3d]